MAGLDLRAGASYSDLVSVSAQSEPILRVIPGNPDGSYLVMKLEGPPWRSRAADRLAAGRHQLGEHPQLDLAGLSQ